MGLDAKEVVFTSGATGGTLLALLTLGKPGGRFLVEGPIYEPMLRQAARLGQVQRLSRRFSDGWQLQLDEISPQLRKDTSVVMITEPHNPSGICAPREQVMELAALAESKGAYLLINEIYRGFSQTPSYAGIRDNVVVVSSLSKFFGTYWARLGWLSAKGDLADRLRNAQMNMGMPNGVSAALGLVVMRDGKEYEFQGVRLASKPLPMVDKWVRETPHVDWHLPQGPGFGTVALPRGVDDMELARILYTKRKVMLVPGTLFQAPGTIRISWLMAGNQLMEGLGIVADELSKIR